MKIVEATWEKRNFGMDVFEITLNKKDLKIFEETLEIIKKQNFKNVYVVLKMPVGNLKALHKLEDLGYRFLETQISLIDNFEPKLDKYDGIEDNIIKNIAIENIPKEKEQWERIIKKITPGMFDLDRVSLDPLLGKEIACKRYKNWCMDLFDNPNSSMIVRKIGNKECGFAINVVDKMNGKIDGIIGGVFEEFKNIGLGISWLHEKNGYDSKQNPIQTSVSSNNVPVLKIHQQAGRIVTRLKYVLRKVY